MKVLCCEPPVFPVWDLFATCLIQGSATSLKNKKYIKQEEKKAKRPRQLAVFFPIIRLLGSCPDRFGAGRGEAPLGHRGRAGATGANGALLKMGSVFGPQMWRLMAFWFPFKAQQKE